MEKMIMEIWDVYNKDREKTGRTIKRSEKLNEDEFHLVVHIWIINSKNEYLIQRRSETLNWMPGFWATTGGSAHAGEDSLTAIIRETGEEIGLKINPNKTQLLFSELGKNEHTDIYVTQMDVSLSETIFCPEDVSEINWASQDKIQKMIFENKFINYGSDYFQKLFQS